MSEKKYTWDIAVERDFNRNQLEKVDSVAQIIAFGGSIKELKIKLKQLSLL